MTIKNSLVSFIMVILIGLISWWTLFSYTSKNTESVSPTILLPDAFMEEVSALFLDKYGKPKMKILTPRVVHYAKDDTTLLTKPELTLYQKSTYPWFINANYAKAIQGIDLVKCWSNVTIHHAADEDHPATFIKTATLTIHPNKQTAETLDLITLIQPNLLIKAKGMNADLIKGDIKLLSQARGVYVPD